MNKANKLITIALLSSCTVAMAGCNGGQAKREADKDNIVFIKAAYIIGYVQLAERFFNAFAFMTRPFELFA